MSPVPIRVGVVGAGEASEGERAVARAVGRAIARSGAVLFCGGLGGVMEAAAVAARQAGGRTVGILPGDDARTANAGIELPIVTAMHQARNVVLVQSCDAIIAVGGGYGTLSEIATARKLGIPLVGLGTWRLDEGRGAPVPEASTPEDAVQQAMRLAAERRERGPGDLSAGRA